MRRTHSEKSASPNTNSPPRSKQRLNHGHLIQHITAGIAAHSCNTYYAGPEIAELQRAGHRRTNLWAYKNIYDDEATSSEPEKTKKADSKLNPLNLSTTAIEQMETIRNILQYSPETEEEYEDDDDDGDNAHLTLSLDEVECDFIGIPNGMLCDEGASFKYNDDGNYHTGYFDAELVEHVDYDDIHPSTSKRAREKLFILQTSAWMDRPNIGYEPPNNELRHSTTPTIALNKLTPRIRLRYAASRYERLDCVPDSLSYMY